LIRGIYTSASGMLLNQKIMDVTANNLANTDTTGYKKDTAVVEAFQEMMMKRIYDTPEENIGYVSLGADVSRISVNFSDGIFKRTQQPLDLAIKGSGFFVVELTTQNGQVQQYLTRNGAFQINKNGELVNNDGLRVLGQKGAIKLSTSDEVRIDAKGNVYQNGKLIDKILLVDVADKDMVSKVGNNLFTVIGQTQLNVFNGEVLQGYLEGSNVNAIQEMVNMINGLRNYESNQKALMIQDETLEKAVNEIVRK